MNRSALPVRADSRPEIVKVEFHVDSLDASQQFYRDVLQMSCDLHDGKMHVGESLVLSERPGESDPSSRGLILTLAVANLLEAAARFETFPDLKFSWGRGSDTLWLVDPDGKRIRIVTPVSS